MAETRLLVPAVLRPFGEHLAAIVQARPGDICVDIGSEGGVMPALLGRVARLCIGISDDAEALADTRDELSLLHLAHTALLRARADALPLRDGCAQVVTALFSLPQQPNPAAALREMLRVLDPHRGRLAVAMWSEAGAVPHLAAALAPGAPTSSAAAGVHAYGPPLAAEHLVEQAGGADRLRVSRIHDVVRFDGLSHWWAAVADDPSQPIPPTAEEQLGPHIAADGTMRIPCEAVVLTTEPTDTADTTDQESPARP